MNPNDSNDVYAAACDARFHERHRVLDVIRRGAEDDEPPPDESLLGAHFFEPFVAAR
jgi:hypothetical protein